MRYTIGLPHLDDAPEFGDIDVQLEIAQAIEGAGLDACCVTDHPFPLVDETQTGHHAFDPFVILAGVAKATTRLGLHHSAIILPYRNPFLVANAVATLDALSGGGRVVLAVASGYLREEFAALGVDFAARGELMNDGLEAIKQAWTGEPVYASTRHWVADGNTMLPTPRTRPRPPLWMGGNSAAAIERAVMHCDGWAPFGAAGERARHTLTASIGTFAELEARIALVRETCERHERAEPLEICLVRPPTDWGGSPDPARVREEVDELGSLGVGWVSFRFDATSLSQLLEKIAAWGELVRSGSA